MSTFVTDQWISKQLLTVLSSTFAFTGSNCLLVRVSWLIVPPPHYAQWFSMFCNSYTWTVLNCFYELLLSVFLNDSSEIVLHLKLWFIVFIVLTFIIFKLIKLLLQLQFLRTIIINKYIFKKIVVMNNFIIVIHKQTSIFFYEFINNNTLQWEK